MGAPGSLPAGNNALVTVTPYDSGGNPLPGGATVYLSLTGPGSFHAPISCGSEVSAGAHTSELHTPTYIVCLHVTYTAPSTLPDGGTATLTAAADSSGSNAASDTYTYAPAPELDHFVWSPVPMASFPTRRSSDLALVTVTPYDSGGNPLPGGATVYLSLTGPGSFHAPISCGSEV